MSQDNSAPTSAPVRSAFIDQLDADTFDWFESVGGWRGMAESTLPLVAFLAAYTTSGQLWWSAVGSAAFSAIFLLVRIVWRLPITPAISGLIGVGISCAWALMSGKDENYFAFGLLTTALWAFALGISALIKQPLAAHVVSMVWTLPQGWMKNPDFKALYSRCLAVTLIWFSVFTARLIIQLPLWWGAQVASLGTVKLAMGLPLFAVAAWLTWLLLRGFTHLSKTAQASVNDAGNTTPDQN